MSTLRFIVDNFNQVMYLTWEHIWIVGIALLIATPIGVVLGIVITKHEQFASRVLNGANILMTIPSLALFGLMLPILALVNMGLGKVPAVIALILYSPAPYHQKYLYSNKKCSSCSGRCRQGDGYE